MYVSLYRPAGLRPVSQAAFGNAMDRLFGDWVVNHSAPEGDTEPTRRARFDLIEKADHFEALVDLPGIAKEDIEVDIEGNIVRVTANAKVKTEAVVGEGERVLHTERNQARFARSFELPSEVSNDAVSASFENGVLKLVLPKKEEARTKRIQIQ